MTVQKAKPRKRAWILGAGFSRSLGGPLMNDLLSIAAWRQLLALYRQHISERDADLIFWLYHYGAKFPEGPLDPEITGYGERRWGDAEQFLEILDRARAGDTYAAATVAETYAGLRGRMNAPQGIARERYPGAFGRDGRPNDEELSKMAKRMVAASCSAFLHGVTRDSTRDKERWLPYQEWLACLTADDTILTFNYDLVVETMNSLIGNGVFVAGSADDDLGRVKRLPFLYKLHGSVNWHLDAAGQLSRPEWTPAMLASDKSIAIATPGDSKMKMAGALFGRLWNEAAEKLHEAEEVYIIGFRFPQGDAFPRHRLLDALRPNNSPRAVHVVLGPDRNSDQARVLALLQWTLGARAEHDSLRLLNDRLSEHEGHKLYAHSAWAEDFLDSWARANRDS